MADPKIFGQNLFKYTFYYTLLHFVILINTFPLNIGCKFHGSLATAKHNTQTEKQTKKWKIERYQKLINYRSSQLACRKRVKVTGTSKTVGVLQVDLPSGLLSTDVVNDQALQAAVLKSFSGIQWQTFLHQPQREKTKIWDVARFPGMVESQTKISLAK